MRAAGCNSYDEAARNLRHQTDMYRWGFIGALNRFNCLGNRLESVLPLEHQCLECTSGFGPI